MQTEEIVQLLKSCLQRDGVKLWLEPYTMSPDSDIGHYPEDILDKYRKELNLERDLVVFYLNTLRTKALDNLKSRQQFQQSGLAVLRIRSVTEGTPQVQFTLETSLNITGKRLKEELAEKLQVSNTELLKVICMGKVVQEATILSDQKIKNKSQILVIHASESQTSEVSQHEEHAETLNRTKEATDFLINEDSMLEITDQNGVILEIPQEERKALCLAMALYNKGTQAMEDKKFSEALVLFLEAEAHYQSCNSALLSTVDNYGLLCLDIVWCYLLIKNIDQLPDAESRLEKSEGILKKSYGLGMERLEALKGDSTKEQSLFVRLYLLKGALSFHKHDMELARFWLEMAATILKDLKVDSDKMAQVMNLGFTLSESRLALRSTHGDVEMAAQRIINDREMEQKRWMEERENERKKALLTKDGSEVSTAFQQDLINMGFLKNDAYRALQQFNNSIDQALQSLLSKQHVDPFPQDFTEGTQAQQDSQQYNADRAREKRQKINEHSNFLNLPYHVEAHLDLSLEEEETLLIHYQKLLESLRDK